MRTVVVSDLHLGSAGKVDLLRRADLRAPLVRALAGVDRLVLLGDTIELREAPLRAAAGLGAEFLAAVGAALGPDGEVLIVGGNHDHGLVGGWIDGRLETEEPGFLALDERVEPSAVGAVAAALAAHAAPARVTFAYPGVWLRDDVYATHGHYSDVHTTVPTFERIIAGAMARWVVPLPGEDASPDDYEAILGPMYAWMRALAQRGEAGVVHEGGSASARAWVALAGGDSPRARRTLLGAGYGAAVRTLNAVGVGPLERRLSGAALRRGGLHGMGEVLRRLGVRAPHVIFGHTHRSGPWPEDDPAEWIAPTGARLLNTGSWVYQGHFLTRTPNVSPYWPGTAAIVDDEGSPRLERLLGYRAHADIAPDGRAAAAALVPGALPL